ncbi:TRAP transporter small permease [Arhodomonas sp. SL1]|uniref:TRAP transporter small permease n=1 Tax=Arhodomonas sp. SL1 TaxID=3425691 RepID=UPI003F881007
MAGVDEGTARAGSSNPLVRVLAWLDWLLGVVERLVVGGGVLLMAAIMCGHVIGRLFFGQGIPGSSELTALLIIVITFIGISYAARNARHISMSALYDQLTGTARKALLVVICLGTGALMFYFAWKSYEYTASIYDRGRTSSALGIPLWMVYLTAPLGFTLAGVQYWLTAIRNLISRDLYRSFTEKEQYAEVPEEGNGGEEAAAGNNNSV